MGSEHPSSGNDAHLIHAESNPKTLLALEVVEIVKIERMAYLLQEVRQKSGFQTSYFEYKFVIDKFIFHRASRGMFWIIIP